MCVTAAVERSLSIACAAAQHSSLSLYVFPCVTLVGVISAISLPRSEETFVHHVAQNGIRQVNDRVRVGKCVQ